MTLGPKVNLGQLDHRAHLVGRKDLMDHKAPKDRRVAKARPECRGLLVTLGLRGQRDLRVWDRKDHKAQMVLRAQQELLVMLGHKDHRV